MKKFNSFFTTITVSVSVLSLPAQAVRIGQGTDLTQNPLNVNNTPNGLYHQIWYYPQQGITLHMTSETPGERQTVFNTTLMSPSTLKTQRGIRIGDSYTEVMQAYKEKNEEDLSILYESFVAGSLFGSLSFSFKNGSVKKNLGYFFWD